MGAKTRETTVDSRAIVEALGFDPTNHHNAAKCPYCNPHPPDDDFAVDEAWLRSTRVEYRRIFRGDNFEPEIIHQWGSACESEFCCIPLIRRTRGDVRLLCQALEIELKED